MAASAVNVLDTLESPGLEILQFGFSNSFDQLGPTINITSPIYPGSSSDEVDDERTFTIGGASYRCFLASKTYNASSSRDTVDLSYISVHAKKSKITPSKEIRFTTVPAEEYDVFVRDYGTPGYDGTAKDILEYIPLMRRGNDVGDFGWKFKEIAAILCDAIGLRFVTNIPDFFVSDLAVTGSYFDALIDMVKDVSPKYFVSGNTLYVVSYGGTFDLVSTGSVSFRAGSSISFTSAAIENPQQFRVIGGDGLFSKTAYVGKKSATTELQEYTGVIGANVFADGFRMPYSYKSYGPAFVIASVDDEVKPISPDMETAVPTTLSSLAGIYASLSPDGKLTGVFRGASTKILSRTFFDEPGETVYTYERSYLKQVVEGELEFPPSDTVQSEVFEVFYYGDTLDVMYEKPRLSSSIVGGLYTPVRVRLENAPLPSKISGDDTYSLNSRLMPKMLELEYRCHAATTNSEYDEGDLMWIKVLRYAPCLVLPEGRRRPLFEAKDTAELAYSFFRYPSEWTAYDPNVAKYTELLIGDCLIYQSTTTYRRVSKKRHVKTTYSESVDAAGSVVPQTQSVAETSPVPNEALVLRKAPIRLILGRTTGNLDQPPYEINLPNIRNRSDIAVFGNHLRASIVRPRATMSVVVNGAPYFDVGWKAKPASKGIRNAAGKIIDTAEYQAGIISQVSIAGDASAGSSVSTITVDLFD